MSKRTPTYNPEAFTQGDTWTMKIAVQDNNGAAKDLTGYTAKYQLREKAGGSLLIGITSTSGISINTSTGEITLIFTSVQSALFNFNKAKCALQIASSATPPVVITLFQGEQEIYPRIVQ